MIFEPKVTKHLLCNPFLNPMQSCIYAATHFYKRPKLLHYMAVNNDIEKCYTTSSFQRIAHIFQQTRVCYRIF